MGSSKSKEAKEFVDTGEQKRMELRNYIRALLLCLRRTRLSPSICDIILFSGSSNPALNSPDYRPKAWDGAVTWRKKLTRSDADIVRVGDAWLAYQIQAEATHEAIRALVDNLMRQLGKGFAMLQGMPWGQIAEVGDHSEYVDELTEVLQSNIPKFAEDLEPAFFNMFCNKFIEAFIPKYTDTIYKCKNVDIVANQQMLLDSKAVRGLLLKIPSMGDVKPSNMFTKLTNKDMARVEDLMKTLMADNEQMVEVFLAFDLGSASDFERLCGLKGLKKPEIDTLLKVLQSKLASKK